MEEANGYNTQQVSPIFRNHQHFTPPAPLIVFKYTPPLKKRSGALNFDATGMIWENDVMYPKHTSNRPADHCCDTCLDWISNKTKPHKIQFISVKKKENNELIKVNNQWTNKAG